MNYQERLTVNHHIYKPIKVKQNKIAFHVSATIILHTAHITFGKLFTHNKDRHGILNQCKLT